MRTISLLAITLLALAAANLSVAEVPSELPDPDGKPGDVTKPVKVYLLAGQSNMVGMGDISGAKNAYTGVYFSSDPAVTEGPFQIFKVGNYKVSVLDIYKPDGTPTSAPIAEGQFEITQQGNYRFHCGFGESSFCTMKLDGMQVYSRDKEDNAVIKDIELKPGTRYTFKIIGFTGTPPRFWMEKTDLLGNGDLEAVAKREGKFPWLVDDEGNWTVRNDVYFQEARLAEEGNGLPLTATSNGKSIGPELGFGHVMGTYHDEQVLLIKTAQGNRSLGFDFRPPSSGRTDPNNKFESIEYTLMIEGVRKTLDNIDKVVPGYAGQGYELAGFAWFQGHKDSFDETTIADYEQNLVNLINDVRKEFDKPKLPAVIATVGFGGDNMNEKFVRIFDAQMAVANPAKHPEFAGTVASVDTRDYWREVDESPTSQDYHYNRNAETYMLIGDAMGRAMVGLEGGAAEPLPLAPRYERASVAVAIEPTEEQKALAQKALRPIIVDGIAAAYIADPRNKAALVEEATGQRPQRPNQFLRGTMYGLENCYNAVGIDDYNWHPAGPDLDEVEWDYFSFDPAEKLPLDKGNRYRKVTYPEGMENWTAPNFDAAAAGWRKGRQPFGQLDGKLAPLSASCTAEFCRCSETPKTLWEKEVLLIRGTIEPPTPQPGYRYRIVLGGAAHVNSGEGYAIYVNGKLAAESTTGAPNRQGGQPRGGYIYADLLDEMKGDKVTIAATSFLSYHHPRTNPFPPQGHLTLQIEAQKLPPLVTATSESN